jgi:hypothetical protein
MSEMTLEVCWRLELVIRGPGFNVLYVLHPHTKDCVLDFRVEMKVDGR